MDKITIPYLLGLIVLISLHFDVSIGQCFGQGCLFDCNCVDGVQCNSTTGECPNGCLQLKPSGYGWGGPACQVGNLAINGSASQSSTYNNDLQFAATVAVDGLTTPSKATHTFIQFPSTKHWWEVELPYVAVIINITVFNRDTSPNRLSYFNIRFGNSTSPMHNNVYAYHDGGVPASGSRTMTNPSLTIGKFVSIQLTENSLDDNGQFLCLSEVVVFGYKYIECPPGYVLSPGCLQECAGYTFGNSCARSCNCRQVEKCNTQTGSCPSGCRHWYAGEDCYEPIVSPGQPNFVSLPTADANTINITWSHPSNINQSHLQHYDYEIQMKLGPTSTSSFSKNLITFINDVWTSVENTTTAATSASIGALSHNTNYAIRVVPYRKHYDDRQAGQPSSEIYVKTDCTVPVKTEIVNVNYTYQAKTSTNVRVTWQNKSHAQSGCDNIYHFTIHYTHTESSTHYSHNVPAMVWSIGMTVWRDGEYIFSVWTYNNKNYYSIGNGYAFKVEIPSAVQPTDYPTPPAGDGPNTGAIVGGVLGAIVIISFIGLVISLIMYKRVKDKPKDPRNDYVNQSQDLPIELSSPGDSVGESNDYATLDDDKKIPEEIQGLFINSRKIKLDKSHFGQIQRIKTGQMIKSNDVLLIKLQPFNGKYNQQYILNLIKITSGHVNLQQIHGLVNIDRKTYIVNATATLR